MNETTFIAHIADEALPLYCREIDVRCPLDRWISYAVKVLRDHGVEPFESCEGGKGHCFPEPTIRFIGGRGAGFKALAVASDYGLPVYALRRYWTINEGELTGPDWEMTFVKARLVRLQRQAERDGLLN